MDNTSASVKAFEFHVNPTGPEVVVSLKFSGIATGSYKCQFETGAGEPLQTQEGNIEKPQPSRFAAGAGLRKVSTSVKSVPFFASDPGSYRVVMEQPGGNRLETPEFDHKTEVEITVIVD